MAGTNHARLMKAESETTGPGRLEMAGAGNHERWGPCMIMFVIQGWGATEHYSNDLVTALLCQRQVATYLTTSEARSVVLICHLAGPPSPLPR